MLGETVFLLDREKRSFAFFCARAWSSVAFFNDAGETKIVPSEKNERKSSEGKAYKTRVFRKTALVDSSLARFVSA